jgi:hypothetical protein
MVLSRQLLFRSGIWELARPRHPLTAGHILIRLSDPSTEFNESSAADWLHCHNLARAALQDVLGAGRCAVMFAHRWHPLGSAVGEPVAESSTPTFHLFARWEGETTTPGRQLSLPSHRRVAEPEHALEAVDMELRQSIRFFASGPLSDAHETPGAHPAPRPSGPHSREPGSGVVRDPKDGPRLVSLDAAQPHCVIEPPGSAREIAELQPADMVAIAATLGALPLPGGVSGFSCVAVEAASDEGSVRIHAVGRSGAETESPLPALFTFPEVNLALL